VAHDASQLLGAQQLAGTTVNPGGFGWEVGTYGLPVIGKAVAKKHAQQDTSDTPKFPRIAFLAVTDQEIALLKIGSGGFNGRLQEVTARVPRSDVASAGVSRGLLRCGVTIKFTDGGSWELEVSRLIRRRARQVVQALGY
jgi:hypothetical protein